MAFTEYHDKINAFPADRSDQPFSICIFAAVSEETSGDFECRWITADKYLAISSMAIPDQVTRDLLPAAGLAIHSAVGCAVTPNHRICRRPEKRSRRMHGAEAAHDSKGGAMNERKALVHIKSLIKARGREVSSGSTEAKEPPRSR